ncbi:uncharacterized protein EV422DRAFT_155063 [Fimicolochytrium jonesii]|uniref:uncharacterized protein n=1 Tax=Fimicolochytrium jonesii TaxID=1396493 RepID=UPI0022FDF7B0|nr:uncharacterized protein EV422DRAFT_155063 [Fimicolochytrium jonesii]KAI8826134.1 hypothetical protein EV422DRAFT_155063 [Fimicolochytrium jonesii]
MTRRGTREGRTRCHIQQTMVALFCFASLLSLIMPQASAGSHAHHNIHGEDLGLPVTSSFEGAVGYSSRWRRWWWAPVTLLVAFVGIYAHGAIMTSFKACATQLRRLSISKASHILSIDPVTPPPKSKFDPHSTASVVRRQNGHLTATSSIRTQSGTWPLRGQRLFENPNDSMVDGAESMEEGEVDDAKSSFSPFSPNDPSVNVTSPSVDIVVAGDTPLNTQSLASDSAAKSADRETRTNPDSRRALVPPSSSSSSRKKNRHRRHVSSDPLIENSASDVPHRDAQSSATGTAPSRIAKEKRASKQPKPPVASNETTIEAHNRTSVSPVGKDLPTKSAKPADNSNASQNHIGHSSNINVNQSKTSANAHNRSVSTPSPPGPRTSTIIPHKPNTLYSTSITSPQTRPSLVSKSPLANAAEDKPSSFNNIKQNATWPALTTKKSRSVSPSPPPPSYEDVLLESRHQAQQRRPSLNGVRFYDHERDLQVKHTVRSPYMMADSMPPRSVADVRSPESDALHTDQQWYSPFESGLDFGFRPQPTGWADHVTEAPKPTNPVVTPETAKPPRTGIPMAQFITAKPFIPSSTPTTKTPTVPPPPGFSPPPAAKVMPSVIGERNGRAFRNRDGSHGRPASPPSVFSLFDRRISFMVGRQQNS